MIISSASDYRKAAKRKLPKFLFEYIDGGAYAELTLKQNICDLEAIALRQRILQTIDKPSLNCQLLDQELSMPIVLAPIGITGMYARRGEVKMTKAAANMNIPYTLSTVSICSIEEVMQHTEQPIWFQLYVLKDRGFMKHVLEKAQLAGINKLVFTVDMPMPGTRYRDKHSGMAGPLATYRRILQAISKPSWAVNVGLLGRPHTLGNIGDYLNKKVKLDNYIGWLNKNFDPSIGWKDLEWIRDFWQGSIIIKGILDKYDAKDALLFGADALVVSNHGGRQLDGVLSTAKALPEIAVTTQGNCPLIVDSGVRSGLDVVRMLALGANAVMLGRSPIYALAASGQKGVEHLLKLFADEMLIAMTLTGVSRIQDIHSGNLALKVV